MIMAALQEEVRMPLQRGEGPVGLIICPSRELARQTFDIVEEYAGALREGESLGAGPGCTQLLRVCLSGHWHHAPVL
jgi:superfamily II DNA/RNA helicase